MNLSLIIIALLFLINPSVAVFDLLPDFFAWLIVLKLIGRVKHLSIKMNIASEYVLKLVWVGFGRIAAFFLIPYVDGTMELTLTFVFCIMELVWGIPAIKALFGGIGELSELYGGTQAYKPVYKLKSEGIHTVQNASLSFFIVRAILNVMPEFLELTGQSSDVLSEGARPLLSFKPLVYYFTFGITVVFGIILVVLSVPFFKRVFSDKPMLENVKAVYKTKIIDTGIHNAKALLFSLMLITVAGLFVFSLMLDSMNIMPRFLFPLLFLCALGGIKQSKYKISGLVITSLVSAVLSVISYVLRWIFVIVHGYFSISESFEAYDFFALTSVWVLAEMISFAILYFMTARVIMKIARDNSSTQSHNDYRMNSYEEKEIKRIKIKTVIAVILFIIGAIVKADSFVLYAVFPEIWIDVLVIDVIWFLLSYSIYNDVKERIENKYLI